MNRSPQGLQLSKALAGFLQHKTAEGLSPNTLCNYEHYLKLWLEYAGDTDIGQVTPPDVRAYLAWLRTGYRPHCIAGGLSPLLPIPDAAPGRACVPSLRVRVDVPAR